jgi:hypothetical protein
LPFFCFCFFLWNQSLNSWLHACKAGTLLLKPCPPGLLALVILEIGFHFGPGWPGSQSFYFMLPTIVRITGVHHHPQLFPVEMRVSWTFLPGLTWHYNPPTSLWSLGWQVPTTMPSYWLRWRLQTLSPAGLKPQSSWISASQVVRIAGVSNQCSA